MIGFVLLAPAFGALYWATELGRVWWARHWHEPWQERERERNREDKAKAKARRKRCVKYRNTPRSSQVRNSWTEIQ
jgi:hypothetical protein